MDPRLTQIVFENIISNAVEYTPIGGKIKLVVKKTEKDIFIKVSDTGYGIPREEQPKIFTKLYRDWETDRKSTRLNSSHSAKSRMPSSA